MSKRILPLVCIFLFFLAVATCDASSVSRAFSKTTANPSETISANLTVTITDARDDYYAIDETYPSGWAVVNPGGGDTSQPNHLKWAVTTGAANIVYTYTITAPSSPGTYTFSGWYEFNTTYSLPSSPLISGQTQVTVSAPSDTTPPSAISNLAVPSCTYSSCALTWNAPGDDGSTGTAASYDVRYSTSTITAANWNSASQATGEPAPKASGQAETFTVTPLSASTTYYFAVRASDEVPNMAGMSNVPSRTTLSAPDTTPPTITFVLPTPTNSTTINNNYIEVSVSISENPSSCILNWHNGTWTNVTAVPSGMSCYWNMTGLSNQVYQFKVYANDTSGNMGLSPTRQNTVSYTPPDIASPTIQITSPTSNPTYSTSTNPLTIGGTASDNVAVTQVNWSNNRGGSGTATGTTSWTVSAALYQGENNITVVARDATGNTGSDMISVNYTQPCADGDSDGFTSSSCGGTDCNDTNPNIRPNATETCNGIDDNCDGFTDPGCVSPVAVTTSYYDGSTTNFSAINVSENITGMMLEKLGSGKIVFKEFVKFTQSVNLDSQSNISFNRAYINSSAFYMLNKSATIYLYNLTFVNPQVQRDGSACLPAICTFVSYAGGTLAFNVSYFSSYSAVEGPYCGNGACDTSAGESCSSCQQDCDICPCPSGQTRCSDGVCRTDCGGGGGGGGGGGTCSSGQTRSCSVNHVGICGIGTETCTSGTWAGCPQPAQELCNMQDDSCNSQTDEGLACECYIGDASVCGSNVGTCTQGTKNCNNGVWGQCTGSAGPSVEICDGLDNDCDAETDEGCISLENVSDCQNGFIPETGCMCGGQVYTSGYCQGNVYSETAPAEFPWITVTIAGVIIILLSAVFIIYKEFHKKGRDLTWEELMQKYKSSFYKMAGRDYF